MLKNFYNFNRTHLASLTEFGTNEKNKIKCVVRVFPDYITDCSQATLRFFTQTEM